MLFTDCPQVLEQLIREFAAPQTDIVAAVLQCIEAYEDDRVNLEAHEFHAPVIRCQGHYLSFQLEAVAMEVVRAWIYEQPDPEISTDEVRRLTQENDEGPGGWIFQHDEGSTILPLVNAQSAFLGFQIWYEWLGTALDRMCDVSRLTEFEIGTAFQEDFEAEGEGGPAASFPDNVSENHWEQP